MNRGEMRKMVEEHLLINSVQRGIWAGDELNRQIEIAHQRMHQWLVNQFEGFFQATATINEVPADRRGELN